MEKYEEMTSVIYFKYVFTHPCLICPVINNHFFALIDYQKTSTFPYILHRAYSSVLKEWSLRAFTDAI